MNQIHSDTTRALVLDDDEDTRFAISRILGKCGCEVVEADSVVSSVEILEQGCIDVVFSDMRIPGSDGGEELVQIVAAEYPEVSIVLMSCAMDDEMRAKLISMGALACLQKPFYKEACLEVLQHIAEPLKKIA